jgi:hypothetical protein
MADPVWDGIVGSDARFDSTRGAWNGSITFMELFRKRMMMVINPNRHDEEFKGKRNPACYFEAAGTKNGWARLTEKYVNVANKVTTIAHDQSATVKKIVTEFCGKVSEFEVWHGAKSTKASYEKEVVQKMSSKVHVQVGAIHYQAIVSVADPTGTACGGGEGGEGGEEGEGAGVEPTAEENRAQNEEITAEMRKTLADEKVKLESKKLKKLSAIVYAKDSKHTEGWAEFWDIAKQGHTKAEHTAAKQGKWDEKKQCHAVKDGCSFCGLLPTGGPPGHRASSCHHKRQHNPDRAPGEQPEVAGEAMLPDLQGVMAVRGQTTSIKVLMQCWAGSVRRHFTRVACMQGDETQKAEAWACLHEHMEGNHDNCRKHFPESACCVDGWECAKPLIESPEALHALKEWVLKRDVKYWKDFKSGLSTAEVESFNALLLKYCNKRIHCKNYPARIHCAYLHWNELMETAEERLVKSYEIAYYGKNGKGAANANQTKRQMKKLYKECDHKWREELLAAVLGGFPLPEKPLCRRKYAI